MKFRLPDSLHRYATAGAVAIISALSFASSAHADTVETPSAQPQTSTTQNMTPEQIETHNLNVAAANGTLNQLIGHTQTVQPAASAALSVAPAQLTSEQDARKNIAPVNADESDVAPKAAASNAEDQAMPTDSEAGDHNKKTKVPVEKAKDNGSFLTQDVLPTIGAFALNRSNLFVAPMLSQIPVLNSNPDSNFGFQFTSEDDSSGVKVKEIQHINLYAQNGEYIFVPLGNGDFHHHRHFKGAVFNSTNGGMLIEIGDVAPNVDAYYLHKADHQDGLPSSGVFMVTPKDFQNNDPNLVAGIAAYGEGIATLLEKPIKPYTHAFANRGFHGSTNVFVNAYQAPANRLDLANMVTSAELKDMLAAPEPAQIKSIMVAAATNAPRSLTDGLNKPFTAEVVLADNKSSPAPSSVIEGKVLDEAGRNASADVDPNADEANGQDIVVQPAIEIEPTVQPPEIYTASIKDSDAVLPAITPAQQVILAQGNNQTYGYAAELAAGDTKTAQVDTGKPTMAERAANVASNVKAKLVTAKNVMVAAVQPHVAKLRETYATFISRVNAGESLSAVSEDIQVAQKQELPANCAAINMCDTSYAAQMAAPAAHNDNVASKASDIRQQFVAAKAAFKRTGDNRILHNVVNNLDSLHNQDADLYKEAVSFVYHAGGNEAFTDAVRPAANYRTSTSAFDLAA